MLYYCRNLVLLSVIIIVGCKFATVSTTSIDTENTTNPDEPSEIQKAVCTVTAGEVRASAEAVTTKTLKGVCGSAEMNLALHNLELKLYKELQEIKLLLKEIRGQHVPGDSSQMKLANTGEVYTSTTTSTPKPTTKSAVTETTTQSHRKSVPQLKSLFKEKTFSYYWKLENFTEHVNGSSEKVESPIFSIKGKPLRIKALFNHLRRDFLYLHLVYASFNVIRDKSNIVLDTGGIFKHINDKVLFKHKISILDQNQGSNDLISQEFNALDSGFPVPMSALLLPTYSKNNSLLIQISLYL